VARIAGVNIPAQKRVEIDGRAVVQRIARGAIIAAGAVVTSDVATFEIWGGVPARKIGERPGAA